MCVRECNEGSTQAPLRLPSSSFRLEVIVVGALTGCSRDSCSLCALRAGERFPHRRCRKMVIGEQDLLKSLDLRLITPVVQCLLARLLTRNRFSFSD